MDKQSWRSTEIALKNSLCIFYWHMMVTQKSHGKNIKICTSTILNEFSKLKVSLSLTQVGDSHLEGGGGMKARS